MKQYVKEILRRFQMINAERLTRAKSTLRSNQRDFIEVLPLLFHINHPALTGYVGPDTPCGMANFVSDGQALAAAKRLTKLGNVRLGMMHNFDIQALFLMGSSGTLAHSTKSDFDIWVCHRSDLTAMQLRELREKCEQIERWADQFNLEVHFFLMDPKKFRSGKVVDLSSESSGTAQHHLLLDEFYRTSLLLEGRYPVWWLVPPEQEKHYETWLKDLLEDRQLYENDFIDFGGLGVVPAEEFFGAGVWQIYKGVDSPYKSVLKILLTEVYAAEYPATTLLSLEYKQAIYDGEHNLDLLDPYVMLLNRLTAYLVSRGQWDRLELVRRCFYFKVGMPLSRMKQSQDNWQQAILQRIIKSWKWNRLQLAGLDDRNRWKIDRVAEERKILVDELTQSYFTLSRFAREHPGLAISQGDLNVLGRKLYAAFERKAGKLELINRGIATDLHESMVVLQQTVQQGGRESWYLFRGKHTKDESFTEQPLKRAPSLMELLTWGFFNGVVDRRTVFSMKLQSSTLSDRELHSIIDVLHRVFPGAELPVLDSEKLKQSSRLEQVLLFVNVGKRINITAERHGQLAIEHTDVLNYGPQKENLVYTVDALFVTSWQEVHIFHHTGSDGLLDCLGQYLQWQPMNQGDAPPEASVYAFSSNYDVKLTARVHRVLDEACQAFYSGYRVANMRYVLELGQRFAVLQAEEGGIKVVQYDSYAELLTALSLPNAEYAPVTVDSGAQRCSMLKSIFKYGKAGVIQLYFHLQATALQLYVIDERGSLFCQEIPQVDPKLILGHYYWFILSTLRRKNQTFQNTLWMDDEIECYQLITKPGQEAMVERKRLTPLQEGRYFNVQVIGDSFDKNQGFSVFCNEREFLSVEYGDRLFNEVVQFILQQRKSGMYYPIYITDIDVSPKMLGAEIPQQIQTIHYLNYKRKIEGRLNQVLSEYS